MSVNRYRGNIVLIELVIVLIFFSLSQAVLVQVFAAAQQKTSHSRLMNDALLAAQDTAEQLSQADDPEALLGALGYQLDGGLYRYDAPAGFSLTAQVSRLTQPGGTLTSVQLSAAQGDAALFTLPVQCYSPGEVQP